MLVDLARRSDLLDATPVHDGDPVRHRKRLVLIVRHVDEGRTELVLDSLQLQLHLLAQLHVECSERLVEQERSRPVDERACERDTLLLAAGELARAATLQPFELDDPQHLVDAIFVLSLWNVLHLEPERDVVVDRHVREQGVLLEDHVDRSAVRGQRCAVLALQQDPPFVRHLEPGDHPQGRGLAAAAGAEQREELSLEDRERHVANCGRLAEVFAHALQFDCDASLRHAR